MFRRRRNTKIVEARLVLDKKDVKVVELKIDGELLSWGCGVPKRTETAVTAAATMVPSPQAAAAAAKKKELEWKFWYNKEKMAPWMTEQQLRDTTAINTTAVSGSLTPQYGSFSPWVSGVITLRDPTDLTLRPTRKGLTLKGTKNRK